MSTPRDWAWPWSPGYGPLVLTLDFEQPAELPERWLARQPALPYRREAPGRWNGPTDAERGELLLAEARQLAWVRSFLEPPAAVRAFDAAALTRLVAGALGPFTWDLADEDYVSLLAAGDDAASLGAHFVDEPARLRARYARLAEPIELDLRHATSTRQLLDAVAVALDRWRELHLGHPRCLEVRAPHALGSDWVRELDVPRLRTTVTFG